MRNIKITIQYDGTRYRGWQRLKNDSNTIQGKIESVLSRMAEENVEIIGSGRTDAGAHAYGQVANFKTNSSMDIHEIKKYLYTYLPEDILVIDVQEMEKDFHARYNVVSKTYVYKIWNDTLHNPFLRKYAEHVPQRLNIDQMKKAAAILTGTHDFTSYCSSKSKKKSNVRTIYSIDIHREGPLLEITLRANGFLYNMVRIITGTLLEVGCGNINPKDVGKILQHKKRALAGPTISPKGLYLVEVEY
ncbi:tRNA pseudouridine(38-40) synthase TruA [Irregularibacter muris]|uniref:tRNA pseudouridine synthase A n=1 Tax=Irregularibacter muris TaxID=1796619 RepID=A0AAE3HJ16_9FIRM|nr:tRNA pseudouridine(38-40) synthase TruA [Irregularibacter muris]MCR1899588.1 tRNA pseudouridine(38-40) synthase TruA [Irregularibacter muris]